MELGGGMSGTGESAAKIEFQKGESVFTEGEPGDAAYVVESGTVEIYKKVEGERVRLATLNAGELFGEMAIIDGSERMASAVALEYSVVIKITRYMLEAKLEKYDSFMQALIKILITNLRNVHRAYMRRARSIDDYMNAINYHADGFRQYMKKIEPNEPHISAQAIRHLDAISGEVHTLRKMFSEHKDTRSSVLTDSDLVPHTPKKTD